MLFCQSAYGFKAYDCQNENVSTTAFSLLAPDTCWGVASDLKFERQLSVEMIQIKRERSITVQRCMVMESLVTQHCGMHLHAGAQRWLWFREQRQVAAEDCRGAFASGGFLRVGEDKLLAQVGGFVSHTLNVAGDIDSSNKCTTGTLLYNGHKLTEQVASRILKIGLFEELA